MGYLKSDSVRAFPLAKPRSSKSNDITSRIFYEQNVSNLIRQIVDVDGFIISGEVSTEGVVENDSTLCIDIYGYYFEILPGVNLVSIAEADDSDSVYVGIKVLAIDENSPEEIDGQDLSGDYQGLILQNGEFPSEYKSFKLLEKVPGEDDSWRLVKPSYKKFNPDSLGIDWIDAKR